MTPSTNARSRTQRQHRRPIVFVHGNGATSESWDPAIEYLEQAGYSESELWAIDFIQPTSSHAEMAQQLDDYIGIVLERTDADAVDIVAHSLGVTGARWWMYDWEGHRVVDRFISIAGANHGLTSATWVSRFGIDYGPWSPASFLRSDYELLEGHPLRMLNEDETFGDVRYYTLSGSRDALFAFDPNSPYLKGATRNVVIDESHSGLLSSGTALSLLDHWLTTATTETPAHA